MIIMHSVAVLGRNATASQAGGAFSLKAGPAQCDPAQTAETILLLQVLQVAVPL
jgi:hypothetical protein